MATNEVFERRGGGGGGEGTTNMHANGFASSFASC